MCLLVLLLSDLGLTEDMFGQYHADFPFIRKSASGLE